MALVDIVTPVSYAQSPFLRTVQVMNGTVGIEEKIWWLDAMRRLTHGHRTVDDYDDVMDELLASFYVRDYFDLSLHVCYCLDYIYDLYVDRLSRVHIAPSDLDKIRGSDNMGVVVEVIWNCAPNVYISPALTECIRFEGDINIFDYEPYRIRHHSSYILPYDRFGKVSRKMCIAPRDVYSLHSTIRKVVPYDWSCGYMTPSPESYAMIKRDSFEYVTWEDEEGDTRRFRMYGLDADD